MSRQLEITLLRTFVMLVEEQSVTRVARRLNRTQPAISLQLRRLRDAAGHPVFENDLRHLRLTRHGEMLLPYARQMLKMHDEARSRLSNEEIAGEQNLTNMAITANELAAKIICKIPRVGSFIRLAIITVV